MLRISVIIPVYNVEKYLARCIDSIINQTLKEIEIIILNDGSTDNCESIIKEYLNKDTRIRYYYHNNIGLGSTRNLGIQYAKGEYLAFVDSDDFIKEDMLELLYKSAIKNNSDVVCAQVNRYYEDGKKEVRTDIYDMDNYSLKKDGKENFYKNLYYKKLYSHNAWDKIYRRKLVIDNNIIFGDNKRIFSEDNYFQIQIINHVDVISFVSKAIYYYYMREDSIMNSYKHNLINRHLNMIDDLSTNSNIMNDAIQKKVVSLITFEIIIMEILNIVQSGKKFTDFYREMKYLRKCSTFCEKLDYLLNNKAYELECNRMKKIYIICVANLLKKKLVLIASILTYIRYKFLR